MSSEQQRNNRYQNQNNGSEDGIILETTDLYSILNVPMDANQSVIHNAFKKLSRIYHPDKHSMNDVNYKNAQEQFTKIKYAYDILSDDTKRKVYDMYGIEGVKMEEWSVVTRTRDPNEIQLIYENRKRMAEEDLENRLTQPETMATVSFDFTDIFDRYLKEDPSEHYQDPTISVSNAELRHSVCLGMTSNDQVELTAGCSVRNGIGIGTLSTNWRRYLYPQFNNTWIDITTSISTDSEITTHLALTRQLWDRITLRCGGSLIMPRFGLFVPGISASVNWQITDHVLGSIEYKWNLNNMIKTGVIWQSKDLIHSMRLFINFTPKNMHLTSYYNYVYQFEKSKSHSNNQKEQFDPEEWSVDERREPIRFKIGGRCGVNNLFGEVGITRRITKFSTFGITLSLGVPLGVMAKIKVVRGNQSYIFPLMMSEEINPAATFYGSIVPVAIFFAMKNLLYDPWKQKQIHQELMQKREQYSQELNKRCKDAIAAQCLMQDTANRSYNLEKSKNGLIILRAIYGRLSKVHNQSDSYRWPNEILHQTTTSGVQRDLNRTEALVEETVDVTVPLQVMVENSQLTLSACRPGHTRGQLQGFYDPCLGLMSTIGSGDVSRQQGICRQLFVRYEFRKQRFETIIDDNQQLILPNHDHLIDSNNNNNNNNNMNNNKTA